MIILCRKCEEMSIQALSSSEQRQKNNRKVLSSALLGAAGGSALRYAIPTKAEKAALFNKDAMDTFVSSAATKARGANRSILKYATVGALITAGITALTNKLSNKQNIENIEYSKFAALVDASPFAAEVYLYGDDGI